MLSLTFLIKYSGFYSYKSKRSKKKIKNEANLNEAVVEAPQSKIILQNSQLKLLNSQLQMYHNNNPFSINSEISTQFQELQQTPIYFQLQSNTTEIQYYATFSEQIKLNSTFIE